MNNGISKNVLFVAAAAPGDEVVTGTEADRYALELDVAHDTALSSVAYLEKKLAEYRATVARLAPERRSSERRVCVRRPVK